MDGRPITTRAKMKKPETIRAFLIHKYKNQSSVSMPFSSRVAAGDPSAKTNLPVELWALGNVIKLHCNCALPLRRKKPRRHGQIIGSGTSFLWGHGLMGSGETPLPLSTLAYAKNLEDRKAENRFSVILLRRGRNIPFRAVKPKMNKRRAAHFKCVYQASG